MRPQNLDSIAVTRKIFKAKDFTSKCAKGLILFPFLKNISKRQFQSADSDLFK